MDPLLELGLNSTRWLQETYPQLEGFFTFISTLGLEEFYLALFPLVYWCINKPVGKLFAYLFLLATALNSFLKQAFRGPRPFWLEPDLLLWEESSYGVPSGHVQLATVTYLFLAGWVRRWWAWLLAGIMIVLMAISRVYLGSHFIHDAVVGFLGSALLLLGFVFWQQYAAKGFGRRILGFKLMVALSVPLVYAILYGILRLIVGEADLSVPWASYVPEAELEAMQGVATAVGVLLGVGLGFPLESSRIRFRSDGAIWQRVVRYLLGMAITIAIWFGLGAVFPRDPLLLALPLRVLRYFLVGMWIAYYAPLFFVRLRLMYADPQPGIDLTLS
jgi:membrane-associated phospholipid phosphatase